MKSGQLFWGIFLLTLGGLFLSVRYDWIVSSFDFIWDIWPFIFILWGISLLVKDTVIRPILSGVFGFFIALLIFGAVYGTSNGIVFDNDWEDEYSEKVFSSVYTPKITESTLRIDAGAGKFKISSGTGELIEGFAKGRFSDFYFNTTEEDSSAKIDFELESGKIKVFRNSGIYDVGFKLNENPVWNIKLNVGAAKSEFDFSGIKLRELDLNTGATASKIKIGSKFKTVVVNIDMGAAKCVILLPKETGAKLTGDYALIAKDLSGFSEDEDGLFLSDNYYISENKALIHIDGAIAALEIERY